MKLELRHIEEFGLSVKRLVLYFVLAVTSAVFEGFGIAMFLPVLEYLESGRDFETLEASSRLWQILGESFAFVGLPVNLLSLLGVLVGLMFVRIVASFLRQAYVAWLGQQVLHTTRMSLFDSHIRAEYGFFDRLSTGHLVNLLTTETQRVGGYFNGWFALSSHTAVVLGYLAILFMLSVPMTLMVLVCLGIGAGVAYLFAIRKTKSVSRKTTASHKEFAMQLVELLQAIRLVKLSTAVERESQNVRRSSRVIRENLYKLRIFGARIELLLEPIVVLAAAGIIYFAFEVFGAGLAEVGMFMLILLRLLPLVMQLLRSRQGVLSNVGAIEAVRGSIAAARDAAERQWHGSRTFTGVREAIEFRRVGFTYPGKQTEVFRDLDLVIPAGKMTALVGPSGGGKTTLTDLLAGLRRPQRGAILFDGTESGEFDISSLRRRVAFVSQDAALFNASVRYNLLFSKPDATEEDLWDVLEKARAADFVRALPGGLETVIGERGTQVSGGQRQRLSLARALLEGAPILIMDEPTSALDSETEKEIQSAIESMRKTRELTIVVIAHRLSTIRSADKIAVVMDGRVVEEGTHDELMATGRWYSQLSILQNNS